MEKVNLDELKQEFDTLNNEHENIHEEGKQLQKQSKELEKLKKIQEKYIETYCIMPKNNIDYSNTIVYKIYCKDELITDIYVGHTTNFFVRKYQHKISCKKSEVKIYKTIRNNGGWDNWNMVEISKYNCKDSIEARIMEQKHYEELNASLNSCPPYNDKDKLINLLLTQKLIDLLKNGIVNNKANNNNYY